MSSVRGHREGTLFLRHRDRRWVAMVTMADGKRRSRSCSHRDHRANERRPCETGVANLKDLLRQRDEAIPQDPHRLRVGPYLVRWIASVTQLAPATIRQHEMIIRCHLVPALGGHLLTELAPSDVDAYLTRRDLDPQTCRHHRATLRRALADAQRDGLVSRNAAALSRPPRMRKAERRWLTAAEGHRLIADARDERYWPLWVLILTTGLRVSEALGLGWADMDWQTASLRVERQLVRVSGQWATAPLKTERSQRQVPLTRTALDAMTEQRARQDLERGDHPRPIDAAIFTTPNGKPIHSTNVLPSWYATLRRLGLPRVTIHDLRHSAATIMLTEGVPLPVISAVLGHSSIRVTADLYAHVGPELRRDAANRMERALQ